MKYKGAYFIQVRRELFNDDKYKDLNRNTRWLYVVLNELEHRYTGEKEDFFFRSNEDLAKDCGMSEKLLKQAKKELLSTDLVQSWQMHFIDKETGKKSKKKVTAYRIL
jgi:hypothetical protein